MRHHGHARPYRILWAVAAGLVGCVVALSSAVASQAEPSPAPPGPGTGSSSDELADMVMDVIEHGSPVVPSTTPVPAPAR